MNNSENFIYLGGSHTDDSSWMNDFIEECAKISNLGKLSIRPINPFNRFIDESDNYSIVKRDLAILQDDRLTHIVIKSTSAGSILSTGASCECIIASYLSKPIIIISEPAKNKKLPNSKQLSNDWHHPFVEYFSDIIVTNIHEAIKWICHDIEVPHKRKSLEHILREEKKKYEFVDDDIDPFV
jgi:hypothetical protein